MNQAQKKKLKKISKDELKNQFKAYCAIRGKSMAQIIEEFMKEKVKE